MTGKLTKVETCNCRPTYQLLYGVTPFLGSSPFFQTHRLLVVMVTALLGFRTVVMALMTGTTIRSVRFFTTWVVATLISTGARTMLVAAVISTAAVGVERAIRSASR